MNRVMFGVTLCVASLIWAGGDSAQIVDSATGVAPGLDDALHDPTLHITLDRTSFRAFEPVYLSITSKDFVTSATPEISVWQGNDAPLPVTIDETAWMKGETLAGGTTVLQRQGVPLQLRAPAKSRGGTRDFIFATPGDYQIRVKVGSDAATLKVKVVATETRERDAWNELGDRLDAIINNALSEPPEQTLVNTALGVMKHYPGTVCAGYCQAYMSVSKFKIAYSKSGKSGGKEAYAAVTSELTRVQEAFGDTFLGEQTGFYAAYAAGLVRDFRHMLEIADHLKTHVTPFSDGLAAMRSEVLEHLNLVPADSLKSLPTTTMPTTKPAP